MQEEDEDNDVLVVKRRNVFDVDGGEEPLAEMPAAAAAEAAGKKKKKKLKIKLDAVSGNKVVFDEEGEAQVCFPLSPHSSNCKRCPKADVSLACEQDPFTLLAKQHDFAGAQQGGSGGGGGEGPSHHGLDTGEHETAQLRFERAREELRRRDMQDKAFEKEKRRKKRMEQKARLRAAKARGFEWGRWSGAESTCLTCRSGTDVGGRGGGGGCRAGWCLG